MRRAGLVVQALYELIRYDSVHVLRGFRGIHGGLAAFKVKEIPRRPGIESEVCFAMDWACTFYVKHVRCLQRSVASSRLLRRYGMPAQLVIGYQTDPFLGHAWVEVEGSVVNDSPSFKQRLRVLERI